MFGGSMKGASKREAGAIQIARQVVTKELRVCPWIDAQPVPFKCLLHSL
jgi:hypothetical protein